MSAKSSPTGWMEKVRGLRAGLSRHLPPHFWTPVGLFAGTLGLLMYVNGGLSYRPAVFGFARAEQIAVSGMEAGRLSMVAVQAGQDVTAGQVLARFDGTLLDSEAAVLQAEIAQLNAQVAATSSQARRQQVLDDRQLTQTLDGAKAALAKEEGAFAEAKARLDALQTERSRVEKLVADKLATADDLSRLSLEYAEVAREVTERPKNIAVYREQVAHAEVLLQGAPRDYENAQTSSASKALAVAQKRLEQLETRRKHLDVLAPATGQVLSINHFAGEVVDPGQAIVTLVRQMPTQIVACVGEQEALDVFPGMGAELVSRDEERSSLTGRVITVGPMVDQLPIRCRRTPTVPLWGREVTLQLDSPQARIPGEAFDVRFLKGDPRPNPGSPVLPGQPLQSRASSDDGTAQASTQLPGPQLVSLDMSDVDTHRFNLESSGLTWMPSLSRYVIVSDDPGAQEDNQHAPLVFTATLDGKVDALPLPVTGIASLNDLESIVPVEDVGRQVPGVYVLASQSFSRKGKRSADRTAFLALEPQGNRLQVVGEAHLAEAIDALPTEGRRALGLFDDTRSLNIEGMARWGNAIYLGVKSPVTSENQALIWRMGRPDAFLKSGRLADAELSLFARVTLDAEVDGKTVPGGISELLFLPDGRLLLASTPSGIKEGRQSGNLWVASVPAERLSSSAAAPLTLTPSLLRHFDGLKPEGLSLSATPGKLVVAFDTGGPNPQWMEMPWPH